MSISLKKAIGYGMPIEKFKSLVLFEDKTDVEETLDELFSSTDQSTFIVPDDLYKEIFYGSNRPPIILEKNILSTNYTNGNRIPAIVGPAVDLFAIVVNCDKKTDVIFFPNLDFAKSWYRFRDDIDYAFERWKDGTDIKYEGSMESFSKYVAFGHYPFTNNLMLADGTPTEWVNFTSQRKRTDIFPAVPSEIRFYLKALGVLDDYGVNQLRPIVAQWWS